MFFEGSEKKAEILIDNNQLSLIDDVDDKFWHAMVHRCNAQILSSINNDDCKAFLLSESSLFVWHDRLLILTCGVTQLVKSVEYFLKHYQAQIIQLFYQRKNEYFAPAQHTCFGDDVLLLQQYIQGNSYRFGALDGHHNFVFHSENDFQAQESDKTYEFLAYQICEPASKLLTKPNLTQQEIREFLNLAELLPNFQLDDFVFDPFGYSINAIHGTSYLTIHVTPQESSSYVSVEGNFSLTKLVAHFLHCLQPKSFDLLSFNDEQFQLNCEQKFTQNFVAQAKVKQQLSNQFLVCFANYILPQSDYTQATPLTITGDYHAL